MGNEKLPFREILKSWTPRHAKAILDAIEMAGKHGWTGTTGQGMMWDIEDPRLVPNRILRCLQEISNQHPRVVRRLRTKQNACGFRTHWLIYGDNEFFQTLSAIAEAKLKKPLLAAVLKLLDLQPEFAAECRGHILRVAHQLPRQAAQQGLFAFLDKVGKLEGLLGQFPADADLVAALKFLRELTDGRCQKVLQTACKELHDLSPSVKLIIEGVGAFCRVFNNPSAAAEPK